MKFRWQALIACVMVAGCGKGESGAAPNSAPLSRKQLMAIDRANTFGQIDATMFADSVVSAAAATRAHRPEVREFAAATVSESHQLRVEAAIAAKAAGITPALLPNDITAGEMALTLSLINSAAPGMDVDGLYMSGTVSRDLAAASLASLKTFAPEYADVKPFLTKIATAGRARAATIAAFEQKK